MIENKPDTLGGFADLLTSLVQRVNALEGHVHTELADIRGQLPENRASVIVFSGDLDKTLAAFIIATGAASMGMEVSMFFTFWGLSALKEKRTFEGKNLAEKMMALMTPRSSQELAPSKMAFLGAGSVMLRHMMKDKEVASLEELMAMARELGVRVIACEMSMEVMGVKAEELQAGCELGGVATFLADASRSKVSLFI
jgi:peroxiredoxin family protein